MLVNGHGSNRPICEIVTRRVTHETSAMCATLGHFGLCPRVTCCGNSRVAARGTAHACEAETSEYLYLWPDLVQRDKIADECARTTGPGALTTSRRTRVRSISWSSGASARGRHRGRAVPGNGRERRALAGGIDREADRVWPLVAGG